MLPKEEPEKIMNSFFGINVFNTEAVRERISSLTGFDGIAPRWTIFGNLMDPEKPENRVLSSVKVIDSSDEIKLGMG